jgi:hypothetical protein
VPNDVLVCAPGAGFTEYDDDRAAEAKHEFFVAAMISGVERNTDITVTCLMPGPTETEFFRRADMLDTPVGTDT